jgi:hypothetical protein
MGDYIETETFDSAEEFVKALRPLSGCWMPEPSDWIFRGQAKVLPLLPSAMRPDGLKKLKNAGRDHIAPHDATNSPVRGSIG